MQTAGSARLCGGSRTRADRRAQAFRLAETLPQDEFISSEDVRSSGVPVLRAAQNGALGKIEGELKQKLMELRS